MQDGCCSYSIKNKKTGESPEVEKSNPQDSEKENVSLLAFVCRYGQVGENASAVLLSVLGAVGRSVKEKLGGEREEGVWSESQRE